MEGYFMVADLLGFGRLVENLPHSELIARVEGWISLVEHEAASCSVPHHQLISDTLFAATDDTLRGLRTLITFGRSLLEKGLTQNLPVRGAITFGSYEWGSLIYGDAVIKAHSLEQLQDWVGIACSGGLPQIDEVWGLESVICYPAPMKRGQIQLRPVVAWEVPHFADLARMLTGGSLTKRGEVLSWEWANKLSRTVEFGLYRRLLKKEVERTGKVFYGHLPIEAFEIFLNKREQRLDIPQ